MEVFSKVNEVRYVAEWDKLPDVSKERIIRYGFQRFINDRCGGSNKTDDDKAKIASELLAALKSGELPTRGSGTGRDPIEAELHRSLIRAWVVKPANDGDKATSDARAAKVKAMSDDEKTAHAEAIWAKLDDKRQVAFQTMAEETVARKAAEREAKRKTADKVAATLGDLDI